MTNTELSIYRAAWGDHPLVAELEAMSAQCDRLDGQLKAVAGELAALKRDGLVMSQAAARLARALAVLGYPGEVGTPLAAVELAAEFIEGAAEWIKVRVR